MWVRARENLNLAFPITYLIVIGIGMLFAFPMEKDNDTSFFFLIVMTLPWSIIGFLVIMFAIHQGFKNETGLVTFIITALLNAFLMYLLSRRLMNRSHS